MNVIEEYTKDKFLSELMEYEYAIYLRKSRADLELEKYSKTDTLKRHRVILLNLAKSMGIDERKIRIYEEVVSGETIKEREEMQKLLENIELKKYKAIFVVEVSRLSRGDKIDQGEITKIIKYNNTLVITPDKTYDLLHKDKDEELFEDEMTNSSKELRVTKKRLNRGRNSSVLEGKYVASIPPYGYNRKKIEDDKGYTLEENSVESIIVKKVFNMYVYEDSSICGIARALNNSTYKPRNADKWTSSTLKDMLRNPIYIGKIRWNHRKTVKVLRKREVCNTRPRNNDFLLVDGLHKGLISQEIWELAQAKLNKNSAPVQHNNVIKNPLSHILICEKCGSYMQRRPYAKSGETTSIQCNNPACNNISSKLHIVEDKIIQGLKYWFKNYKIDENSIQCKNDMYNITYYQTSIKRLNETLEIEKKALDKICEAYERDIYDEQTFKSRYAEIKEKIIQIEHQIMECEKEMNREQQLISEKETIIPKIENVLDVYYKLESAEEKNYLLKTIIEKVTYLKVKKTLKKTDDPTDFEIHIFPKIPKH
ncbi:MAG: recombinase family protein [Clostridia bacterium]